MSEQSGSSQDRQERTELPIERGFPIERVNEIAEKEGLAKRHYRPIYTMHKWWARRMGCVFRTIALYSLVDDPDNVSIFDASGQNTNLGDFTSDEDDITALINNVDISDPESLWELYPKDVRVEGKKVLDPFMGGGTSLVESSRFDIPVVGNDLNPVAWFIVKKELEASDTDWSELEAIYEEVKERVAEEIKEEYKTTCPSCSDTADVVYYFWVKELDCASCGSDVPLMKDYRVAKGRYDNDDKYNVLCPNCESVVLVDDWQGDCTCSECNHGFVPRNGTLTGGKYACMECGQKYSVTDRVEERGGYDTRLYAIEYYCTHCNELGKSKSTVKGYKSINEDDRIRYQDAVQEWENTEELREYIPNQDMRPGWKTASSQFEGSAPGAGDLAPHGITSWTDMFNGRQLLNLSKLLRSIDEVEDQNAKEYLLLAFSETLNYNNNMVVYNAGKNLVANIFKSNSFDPPTKPIEANLWGTEAGTGSFENMWEMVVEGVKYASEPTERYIENGETQETVPFKQPIGEDYSLTCADMRTIDFEDEFDAVITDPPYYHNIIYSELSDIFYVWQRLLLRDEYSHFDPEYTPRAESIVSNPAENKDKSTFEVELKEGFTKILNALTEEGVLAFTYHHSDSESWGELLEALCDVGFLVTATYPITADINKFAKGESVSFDIIVVARPADKRTAVSWNALRREIYRTARRTRTQLEENRELSRGDIGVMEMGECFREYSKHHGKVQRDGEIMSAKEVVQEIYGIIQEASDVGVEDVFIDLLDTSNVSYDDVNKLCRGTNATPEDLKETRLYNQDDGFELGTWDNEKRQAFIQERVNGDGGDHLSNLDKLQFLRYRYQKGQSVQNYVEKWDVDDDLRELAGRLADVTGDDTYTRVLGDRDITSY